MFLPFDRISLDSSRSADELISALQSVTQPPDVSFRLVLPPRGTHMFVGQVSKERLSIAPAYPLKNSFKPFLAGKVATTPSGARIEGVMHPHGAVLAFMAVLALALAPFVVVCVGEIIQKRTFNDVVWQPIVIFGALYPMCMLGYVPAARRMKQFLRGIASPGSHPELH